ncbi:hypothetical protein EC973_007889 [Apophysomyces ossiformis]|uniref:Uncharacterized protein n=1 Tax=Apophysomyces ossiformis TaxID=679940 RepID=A0A8H7EQ57_9FUNG|nr:hypothetical protein EC973_007889 [Apophysomyces ossiformis]
MLTNFAQTQKRGDDDRTITDDLFLSSPGSGYHPEAIVTEIKTIWDQWRDFLEAARADEDIHQYSAEKHGIVICGNGIRPKGNMPQDAYAQTSQLLRTTKRREFHEIFSAELSAIDNVLDSASRIDGHRHERDTMLQEARKLAVLQVEDSRQSQIVFLTDLLVAIIRDIYTAKPNLGHSETKLNEALVWPAMRFALYAVTKKKRGLQFFPGEERLRSMSIQLKANGTYVDERSCYKADGVLRCTEDNNELEVTLLETSNAYGQADPTKINFDFHKGMYGAVSMLKTVADIYKYASFHIMAKLKLYFWHVHTTHIRLWSISCPSGGVFVMMREDKCPIPISFNDDPKLLLDFTRFIWTFKASINGVTYLSERLEETMASVDELQNSNNHLMRDYRHCPLPPEKDLSQLVKPSIIKITERVHSTMFINDGPFSSPLVPPSL